MQEKMKTNRIRLTIVLAIVLLIAFYFQFYVHIIKTKTTPEYFDLRQDEIVELSNRANAKQDLDAAQRLASYYRFTKNDRAAAKKWDEFIKEHKGQE